MKILKYIGVALGIMLGALLLLLALIWFGFRVSPVKDIPPYAEPIVESYDSVSINMDSLKVAVGQRKQIPSQFERSILIALSHFPELADVKISFELVTEGAPLESNFELITLFGSGKNRHYRILLLEVDGTDYDQILMHSLSLDARVAIIAHELCHTLYYHELNTLQVANWGLQYLYDESFAPTHERNTDLLTVKKGFGWQLYEYAEYVRTTPGMKEWYESDSGKWLDNFYMPHGEIRDAMAGLPIYQELP